LTFPAKQRSEPQRKQVIPQGNKDWAEETLQQIGYLLGKYITTHIGRSSRKQRLGRRDTATQIGYLLGKYITTHIGCSSRKQRLGKNE